MSWCTAELPPLDRAYHDAEWGIPVHDDRKRFWNKQACGIVNDHASACPRYHEILRDYPTVRTRRDREA